MLRYVLWEAARERERKREGGRARQSASVRERDEDIFFYEVNFSLYSSCTHTHAHTWNNGRQQFMILIVVINFVRGERHIACARARIVLRADVFAMSGWTVRATALRCVLECQCN